MNYEVLQSGWWDWAFILFLMSTEDCFLYLFGWFIPWSYFLVQMYWSAEFVGKDICKFPDLIVHFSPPWNSVLWMLATHVYWDFRLQLLNLRDCWGFAWVFPFCITSGNSLKVANWGNRRTHLICFLSHGPPLFLLLNIQSQTVVLYMLYFPLVFVIRVNLVPVIPLWLEAQVSIYRILQMYAYVRFFSWEPPYIPWGSLKSM